MEGSKEVLRLIFPPSKEDLKSFFIVMGKGEGRNKLKPALYLWSVIFPSAVLRKWIEDPVFPV